MSTYYLFLHKEVCIEKVFENLKFCILDLGIEYKEIKEHSILPSYIKIVSIYKDQYLLKRVTEILKQMDYDKPLKILKPLVNEKILCD